jgi:hypothetical protein
MGFCLEAKMVSLTEIYSEQRMVFAMAVCWASQMVDPKAHHLESPMVMMTDNCLVQA